MTCTHCDTFGPDTCDWPRPCPHIEAAPTFGVSNRKLRPAKDPVAARAEADAFWGVES